MARLINEVITDRCKQSRALADQVHRLAPALIPCCRRHDLAMCAIDLAVEHHRAIFTLIETGTFGAAAALIRPLLEASTSAFWLTYAASDSNVLKLLTDPGAETSAVDIPTLSQMATALTRNFPAISALSDGLARNGSGRARWLHKYTHGGTPQLVRRDRANGWLEGEVVLALLRADLFVVLGASVLTVLRDDDEFRRYIFDQRDVLAAELASKFSTAVPGGQPRVHPATDKKCCGESLLAVAY